MSTEEIEQELIDLDIDVTSADNISVKFWFKGRIITYFIKKQWATGKTIQDCRGWDNLYRQLKNKSPK